MKVMFEIKLLYRRNSVMNLLWYFVLINILNIFNTFIFNNVVIVSERLTADLSSMRNLLLDLRLVLLLFKLFEFFLNSIFGYFYSFDSILYDLM